MPTAPTTPTNKAPRSIWPLGTAAPLDTCTRLVVAVAVLAVVAVLVKTTTAAEVVLVWDDVNAATDEGLEVETGTKTALELGVLTTAGEEIEVETGLTVDEEAGLIEVLVKGEVETDAGSVKPCLEAQAAGSSPCLFISFLLCFPSALFLVLIHLPLQQ